MIALASTPTYDPTVFVGGISTTELRRLTDEDAGTPLVSRAVAGPVRARVDVQAVLGVGRGHERPGAAVRQVQLPGLAAGRQPGASDNFEGRGIAGSIDLRIALAKSCDTIFYGFAQTDWYADEAPDRRGQKPAEDAAADGPGVRVRLADRASTCRPASRPPAGSSTGRSRRPAGTPTRRTYCADAKRGYPDVTDPARRGFLTRLAAGELHRRLAVPGRRRGRPVHRPGRDHGQPAAAGGGVLGAGQRRHVCRAAAGPGRRSTRTARWSGRSSPSARQGAGRASRCCDYIQSSLAFTPANGASGAVAFAGFPLDKVLVGGKTGTGGGVRQAGHLLVRVLGAGRHARPEYVVVAMIEQAGLGAQAAAPVARAIYEGIYGLTGKKAALPGGPRRPGCRACPTGSRSTRRDGRPRRHSGADRRQCADRRRDAGASARRRGAARRGYSIRRAVRRERTGAAAARAGPAVAAGWSVGGSGTAPGGRSTG